MKTRNTDWVLPALALIAAASGGIWLFAAYLSTPEAM